ncbi:PilX N-terminal domain-containing pilus assembly protein [Acinetobacter sp. Marseille-Q1618]|uniref:PilX N-terminal domain-containing pilus assembly protein n=1 Tax=Acinetobacter sp. Marseille-Q1618 TaxID=2697502 RepID=UPI00156EE1C5|nr:PilX N-terminal domain-containing pilus assembly protein [Acinetobacter sp. Marseille-Q1618]
MNKKIPNFSQQLGSTLVVILILLVVVTIIGTIAIRQGLLSLKVATNSQAQALLLQNTDAYFFKLEAGTEKQKIINASKFGPIGYASQVENIGQEVSYCFTRNNEQAFDTNTVGKFVSGTGLSKGYCNPASADNFTSGRKAVMTQVTIKVENKASAPLENFIEGTDTELVNPAMRIRVNVVSLMPAMSDATNTTIINCLKDNPAEAANATGTTKTSCLRTNNIPYNAQVAEYKQSNSPQ